MRTLLVRRLSRSALCGAGLLACGGFEPDFGQRPPPSTAGIAGWAYDAGVEPGAGATSGSRGGARPVAAGGGTGGHTSGKMPENDAGEAGERGDARGGAGDAGGGGEDAGGGSSGTSEAPSGGATTGGGGAGWGTGSGAGGQSAGTSGLAGRGGASGSAGVGGRAGGGTGGTLSAAGASQGGASQGGASQGEGGAAGSAGAVHALLFSEYVEGSSTFKALEIRALAPSTLDGCRLATYFNGASTASGLQLEGALAEGEVYVLCSTALAGMLGEAVCHRATNLSFNGNDAIALECEGRVVDGIGQRAYDPGVSWDNGEASTLDRTLRRSCSVVSGDTSLDDAFDPASGWVTLPVDTFGGLGDPACE